MPRKKKNNSVGVEEKKASVSYRLGVTKSMGNFESLRIDIGVTLPCDEKNIAKTYKKVKKQVEKWIDEELERFK